MNNSNWETEIIKEIQQLSNDLSESEKKKYQIELLERLIRRIEKFSYGDCSKCEKYKEDIKNIMNQIKDIRKGSIKEYNRNLKSILNHMKEEHGLHTVNEKQEELMHLGLSFGLGIGTGLGLILVLVIGAAPFELGIPIGSGLGMVIGMSLGMSIGSNMDKKNREEGRII